MSKRWQTKKVTRIVKAGGYAARLLIAVIIVMALVGFSPTRAQADASNPVDLELGGEGATSWNINNIQPGDNGTKTVELHNAGSRDGFVTIWLSDIVSSEGINPESETGNTAEPGELTDNLQLGLSSSRLSTNLKLPTTISKLPQSISAPNYIEVIPLKAGDTVNLLWKWNLPAQTGNDAQGDGVSFTVNYLLREFEITNVSNVVTANGTFIKNVTAAPAGTRGKIVINKDTIGKTRENQPLSEIWLIEIDKEPSTPSKNKTTIGPQYDAGPYGTTFDKPVILTFTYDPADIPERARAEDLVIATRGENAGEWVELEGCTVDTIHNTISVPVNHFSRYTIISPVPPPTVGEQEPPSAPAPPTFSVSNLTVQPVEVKPKEPVVITVSVANTGYSSGSYTVVLKIDGQEEAERTVTVVAGHSETVTFSISREEPGSYNVAVDGLSASFTVAASLLEVDTLGKTGKVKIEADGTIRKPLTLTDPDANFVIEVDSGSKITDSDGIPLTRLELTLVEDSIVVPDDIVILSPIYKVTGYLDGTEVSRINFDPPAKLTILYDPRYLPENVFPPFVAYYTVDQGLAPIESPPGSTFEIGKAKALISHASLFVVAAKLVPPPPPLPANFEVSNLTFNPRQTQLGQPIIISLTIANDGDTTSSYELQLRIDGIVRIVKEITLAGKSSETLSFEISNLAVGKHEVKVAGLSGQFRIVSTAVLPAISTIDWLLIDLSAVAAGSAVLLVLYLVWRRSRQLQPEQELREAGDGTITQRIQKVLRERWQ